MAQSRLRSLGEVDTGDDLSAIPRVEAPSRVENAATNVLLLSLRALSQRALIALDGLFVLITTMSAFWLWLVTMPEPSILQLVGLGLYGILIVCLNVLVLRRRA
jgi:hypothetical protein